MTYEEFLTELAKFKGKFCFTGFRKSIRLKSDTKEWSKLANFGVCCCPALAVLNAKATALNCKGTDDLQQMGDMWLQIMNAADSGIPRDIRKDLERVLDLT